MVNAIDLFQLFSEIAGVDPRKYVPKGRPLDAEPMLAYLTNQKQKQIRATNFTQTGDNIRSSVAPPSPCVVGAANVCTSFFPNKAICEKNNGIWWEPGATAVGVEPQQNCYSVNSYLVSQGQQPFEISAVMSSAIRNKKYKLVRTETENCTSPSNPLTSDELYRINEARPIPLLDTVDKNLFVNGINGLDKNEKQQYNYLSTQMTQLLSTYKVCPGDGNLDAIVNQKDVEGWKNYSQLNGGQSSWYDFNFDGLPDLQVRPVLARAWLRNHRRSARLGSCLRPLVQHRAQA